MKLMIFILKRFLIFFYYWLRELLFNIPPPPIYRRTIGGSAWHSSRNCKYWPTKNFEEHIGNPQFGVCPRCTEIATNEMKFIDPDSP